MRLKLLYTLVLILCMSAFASSKNECAHPIRESGPDSKGSRVKELTKEISGKNIRPSDNEPEVRSEPEFSTFQFVKFLYI